jgi:hypothetical protein
MRSIVTTLFLITTIISMAFISEAALRADLIQKGAAGSSHKDLKYHEVCRHVSDMVHDGHAIGTDPERRLGMHEDLKSVLRKYKFTDKAMSFLREMQGYIASVSAIDIDNDGVEELRFAYEAGSAHCEDNHFFKRNRTGKYEHIEDGLDQTGGRLCSGGGLSFFRYKGKNYATIDYSPEHRMDLYSGRQAGFHYECTVQVYSDQVDASTACTEPICNVIRQKAQNIVDSARGGSVFSIAERPIEHPDSLAIDWNSLKPFEREGQLFSIDLDNDGINELVIKQKTSPANGLHYSILKMEAGTYRAIDPSNFYENYKVLGTPDDYLFEDNLVFEKSSDRNYVIAIHFDPDPISCRLDIFLIENRKVSKVGTVNASFKKLKDNLRSYEKN